MDVEDENISTLMSMGFPDIGEIKRALRLAKNDLNEAVAILTNDQSVTPYGPVVDLNIDVDMKDSAASSKASLSEDAANECDNEEGFPETHLYELESRVFTDQWSIPYKKDESLHKCLVAATKLIEEGTFENDDNCQRFLNRCMPEAFRKLLNSGAVRRWNPEIQKGIYNMLELFFDLLVCRLRHKPVPVSMLNQVFTMACDLECEWNNKNKLQLSEDKHWEDLFGHGETFARCPESPSQDPYGWLVDLLNHFGAKNGFGFIQDAFEKEELDPVSMAAILRPLGNCAELLSPTAVCPMLTKCMEKAVNYVTSLEDKDLKHKDIGAVLDLLVALKLLCKCLWPNQADEMNSLRLQVILRMLKTPHFSTRMNALKEVSRLVEEAESTSPKKSSIPGDKLAEWLSDRQVLSVALEGNIDHVQYTDRIKGLVEFLGPRLNSEELSQIWAMGDKSFHVVDNLHGVLAAAAPKLAAPQFDHLLHLVQEKWQRNANDRVREKLLSFLGQLGKECRATKTGSKILEALWELARHPGISCHLVERALQEHLNVLSEIPNKEQLRKTYVLRCIDDLKKGNQGTLPLLRHLLNVAKSIAKGTGTYHKPDKAALAEWNHSHEIVKLLLVSLGRCHAQAVSSSKALGQALSHDTIVDGRYGYRHGQLIQAHLDLLQLLLKEADLYLPWNRCKELWDTLVTNHDACEADRECCFQWFASCLGDMQPETQSSLFREKMLKCDPAHLTLKGFECIKTFFESVNVSDGKMRRFASQTIVEKLDPTGSDFFWQVALESPSEELATEAMEHILNISYLLLAPRMKKDPATLHKKFINDCYKRLESLVPCTKGNTGSGSNTPSVAVSQLNSLPTAKKAACLQNIRRLLELTEKYISTVEESHPVPRTILPHGMSFRGESLCLHIKAEESKNEFDMQVHSHETVWAVKQKIAAVLRVSAEQLMLVIGDRPSPPGREQRPLCHVGVADKQIWLVKSSSGAATVSGGGVQLTELKENWDELPNPPSPVSGASAASGAAAAEPNESEMEDVSQSASASSSGVSSARLSFHIEQEKSLPGIVMASGGHVFAMLYQLSDVDDSKIQETIRRLLHLIPTDPAVQDVLEKVTARRSAASATPTPFDVTRSNSSTTLFTNSSSQSSLNRTPSSGNLVGTTTPAPVTPIKTSSLASSLRSGSFRRGPLQPPQTNPTWVRTKDGGDVKVEDMLKGLLNPSAPLMSPFRVLYNLEVLSGKLMPTVADPATASTTQLFRREFLSAAGLNLVCGVLRKDFFPYEVSYEIRQGCSLIALQLARFLLCGEVDDSSSTASIKVQTTPSKLQLTPTKITPTKISPIRAQNTPIKISIQPTTLSPTKMSSAPSLTTVSFAYSPAKEDTEETARAAIQVLQTLSETEFLDMISCFVRVCWSAAAGKLHLASASCSSASAKDLSSETGQTGNGNIGVPLFNPAGRRSRQSSTGSTSSSSSCGDGDGGLYLGVCATQDQLCSKDVLIACEALELLVTCLEVRGAKELAAFYNFPHVKDFIVDVLLGCVSQEVRDKASIQLFRLSQAQDQSNKHSLTQILVKAPVPLWVPSSTTRGASQRLLSQCSQYFHLRCRLLSSLTTVEQRQLSLDASSMLNDEVAWLSNFSPYTGTNSTEMEQADNALLAGHINVVRGLLSCDGVNRRDAGRMLLPDLLNQFLFPASKMIAEGLKRTSFLSTPTNFNPKCCQPESRLAAYALIVELATSSRENLEATVKQLVSMHHRFIPDLAKEFEYEPAVEGRATCNYVGLKNAGATCYMNSVIQQLFLVPGIKEALLSIDDEDADEETLFFQFQMVMGHLQDSKLQYFVPEKFWRCLRLRGQPVNVREQQDAFEFFTHLVDSIDEHLHKMEREKMFQNCLGGVFSDQMICKECPHRYEREQIFLALNLTVKSHNLVDSLEQFVKGELLEGDNAYYCEECGVKRSTVKRMCIKTLPSTLVIQLKRFYYDWDAGRSLKFDDYFQFPWVLDMAPYTAEGIQERDRHDSSSSSTATDTSSSSSSAIPGTSKNRSSLTLNSNNPRLTPCNYELVGVVVHSGQASAGHYYSFIKERKRGGADGANRSRWLKFNDTTVEEFEMNDSSLEAECFGGTYKAKSYDSTNGFPETRQRYWNGYILFYDRIEDPLKTPRTPRKGGVAGSSGSAASGIVTRSRSFRSVTGVNTTPNKLSASSVSIGSAPHRDSLSQLSELLNHGERQGLFGGKMPARVQQAVREENLRFMKSRDVYCPDYYQFIYELCQANAVEEMNEMRDCAIPSLNLAVHFLCHTYLRVRAKEASRVAAWVDLINQYSSAFKESAFWLIEYWASEDGLRHVRPFLLECPTRSVRHHFVRLLELSISNFFNHGGQTNHVHLSKLIESLLSMLDKDVPDNCKTCPQFFHLLSAYAKMGVEQCQHLFRLGAFHKLLVFLLGADRIGPRPLSPTSSPEGQSKQAALSSTSSTSTSSVTPTGGVSGQTKQLAIPLPAPSPTSTLQRRWSPAQVKDFGDLHAAMATMILNCQLEPHSPNLAHSKPSEQRTQIPLPAEAHMALYGQSAPFYLQELVLASCHTTNIHATSPLVQMMLYVAHGNMDFSRALLREALHQCAVVSASELKNLTQLLQEILLLEDQLQYERLQSLIDGFTDKDGTSVDGILSLIRSQQNTDSRRAYQLMKFLVSLANRLQVAKDYLLQAPNKWQWSVNWLKQKIEQSYWSPHSDLSNEDSNTRIFQRTTSAQVTLEEATALLTEFEGSDMETETDNDFGLGDPDADADASASSNSGESAKRSKCQFSLGS